MAASKPVVPHQLRKPLECHEMRIYLIHQIGLSHLMALSGLRSWCGTTGLLAAIFLHVLIPLCVFANDRLNRYTGTNDLNFHILAVLLQIF